MMQKEVSQRIAMLRFIMIFGVVILHTPPFVDIAEAKHGLFDYSKAFFQNALFRASVPVLTFISGYLLFSSDKAMNVAALYKKKFLSLGVPFLFFNLSLLALAYAAQRYAGVTMSVDLVHGDAQVWLDAALGATSSPINYPLNFLRDLMVIMLLAPLIGRIVRTAPVLGLILVSLVFLNNLDGLLVLRGAMVVVFYLGAMAAVCRIDMTALDKYAAPCAALFVAACIAMLAFEVRNATYLRLCAPLLIWPAASLLVRTRVGVLAQTLSKYSFFLFLAHAPILMVTWLVYQRVAGVVPYQLYWVAAPFLVTAVVILIHRLASRIAPSSFALITAGARPEKTGDTTLDFNRGAQAVK